MKTGDRVICINDHWKDPDEDDPKKGEEYDVDAVAENNGKRYLRLRGIEPHYYNANGFRKLETYRAKENQVNFNFIEEGLEKPQHERATGR